VVLAAAGVSVISPSSRNGSAWQVYGGASVAAPYIAGIFGNNGGTVNYARGIYSAMWAGRLSQTLCHKCQRKLDRCF
jgi:hypothetical protein